MKKCFVIQPFDNGIFDKRYADIFEPTIKKAGFEPYRTDKDLSVRIPIDEIEKGIIDSEICFAEITTDNPNVWYELGYAFACGKDVVMVCSEERVGKKFPFDIQHRYIIEYKTSSKSDFESLEDIIIRKINALQQKTQTVETLNATPVIDTEGLKSHEIALLIIITTYSVANENGISIWYLKDEMNKAGYNDVATSVGVMSLSKNGMIEIYRDSDYNGNEYKGCRLSEKGENWILANQDQLQFRKPTQSQEKNYDDLPF
jgi:hypothetical protein